VPAVTDPYVPTIDPAAAGFDMSALDALRAKVRQQVDEGRMPACQFAFAIDGQLAVFESFGGAGPTTRFNVFSATKAVIGGVVWQLIGEGRLTTSTRAIELIPEFGAHGRTPGWMAEVTLEHLLTHTSGFPYAPLGPPRWDTRGSRLEVFSRWYAMAEPGTSFVYHPTAAHWVVAEMIEALEGRDYRQVVAERIVEPLGLRSFGVGAPPEQQDGIAPLEIVGEPATYEEMAALLGDFDASLLDEVSPTILMAFNDPSVRAAGVPGGGGIGTAADLAMYYQALLHNTGGLWDPEVLADATGHIRCSLPNPMTGVASNRSLGLIIAGDDGLGAFRGMGPTVSPSAFGHNGAAGQIVWGDPANGVSFALTTSGIDPHYLREAKRIASLGAKSGLCGPAT
jgi:CubicO group peptidase (beta-lactamase class C family)